MGTGRRFLLTDGSGLAPAVGAATLVAGGGTGTGRLFLTAGTATDRWPRMPWATLSMSSTVVRIASAISLFVVDTKWGSSAKEARPPSTSAWWDKTMLKSLCFDREICPRWQMNNKRNKCELKCIYFFGPWHCACKQGSMKNEWSIFFFMKWCPPVVTLVNVPGCHNTLQVRKVQGVLKTKQTSNVGSTKSVEFDLISIINLHCDSLQHY